MTDLTGMPQIAPTTSLIAREPRTPWRAAASRVLRMYYRISGKNRYDMYRLEHVHGMPIMVLPSVANPKLLRTGAFLAGRLDGSLIRSDTRVLDLGTGSGVCALFAARHSRHVVAVDINAAAVRCATINAHLNSFDERVDIRHGDLFGPVEGERFDLVLFNPPFLRGTPHTPREAAWRSPNLAPRFAAELGEHLTDEGCALLLLSSFGDACAEFETALLAQGFRLEVFARRSFINESLTLLRVTPT